MMGSEPGTFIWDFDGTLGYRKGMWSGALADIARVCRPDLGLGPEAFRPYLQTGFPWHDWQRRRTPQGADDWWRSIGTVIRHAVARVEGLAPADHEAIVTALREEYLRPGAWALYPDVLPFFASPFAASRRHVILSNHVPELEEILGSLGIRNHFEAIFNSSLTGIEKPHPEAFRQIRRAFPDTRDFLMIGDSYLADIAGAASEGISGVLVRTADDRADRRCTSLLDLPH